MTEKEVNELLQNILEKEEELNEWQRRFVDTIDHMQAFEKPLSFKQERKLQEIHDSLYGE